LFEYCYTASIVPVKIEAEVKDSTRDGGYFFQKAIENEPKRFKRIEIEKSLDSISNILNSEIEVLRKKLFEIVDDSLIINDL
jgi:hypothetical protein